MNIEFSNQDSKIVFELSESDSSNENLEELDVAERATFDEIPVYYIRHNKMPLSTKSPNPTKQLSMIELLPILQFFDDFYHQPTFDKLQKLFRIDTTLLENNLPKPSSPKAPHLLPLSRGLTPAQRKFFSDLRHLSTVSQKNTFDQFKIRSGKTPQSSVKPASRRLNQINHHNELIDAEFESSLGQFGVPDANSTVLRTSERKQSSRVGVARKAHSFVENAMKTPKTARKRAARRNLTQPPADLHQDNSSPVLLRRSTRERVPAANTSLQCFALTEKDLKIMQKILGTSCENSSKKKRKRTKVEAETAVVSTPTAGLTLRSKKRSLHTPSQCFL